MASPLPRYLIQTTLALAAMTSPASAQLRAEMVVSGLTQPVAFVQDPSDPTMYLIVQQNGRVRVLKNGALQPNDYLDLRPLVINEGEQGLLGLAFAPDYAASGRVFIDFINLQGNTVVARFTRMAGDPLRADPASRFDLMWSTRERFISQPFPNHNGGNLVFGPDGFLYIGMGDGGSGNDPLNLAQNPQSLLGKFLRIDVAVPASDVEGFNVPPTNPFVGRSDVRPEIWSVGLRNPWRWSFDNPARGGTGALVIGDVGQGAWEEIDYEPAGRGGRNYGWPIREGAHNNVTVAPFSLPLTEPTFEYPRNAGQSTTGGFVYRGSALGTSFRGRYFFADFVASRVWSLRLSINPTTGEATASDLREHTNELGPIGAANPSSFGEDASGELYIVNYNGRIHRIGSTEGPFVSPRNRPASAPIIGWATPRGPTAAPPSNSAPASAPSTPVTTTLAPPPAVTSSRARLMIRNGEAWVLVFGDDVWLLMRLEEFLERLTVVSRSRWLDVH